MGVDFRWISGEPAPTPADDTFPELASPSVISPRPAQRRLPRRRLLLLLVPIMALAGLLLRRAQQGEMAAHADLQRAVDGEVALLAAAGPVEEFLALQARTPGHWQDYHRSNYWRESAWFAERATAQARVEGVRLQPGRATVNVALRDGEQVWRGTWYYALVDGEWRHTAPPAEALGEKQTAAVGRVTVTAQGLSAAEAQDVAEELDALCEDLMQHYLLPSEGVLGPAVEGLSSLRVAVEVSPYCHSADGKLVVGGGNARLDLKAPLPQFGLELVMPEERVASLRRGLRLALASRLLEPAGLPAYALTLRLAEVWEPEWQGTVRAALADGTWRRYLDTWSPGDMEEDEWWREVLGRHEGAPEAVLMKAIYDWSGAMQYTLGDYLYATYPSDRLVALLQATHLQPSPWPGVESELGLTREELEAEWGAFLLERYGDAAVMLPGAKATGL